MRRIWVASVAGMSILYTAGEMPLEATSREMSFAIVKTMADENTGGVK